MGVEVFDTVEDLASEVASRFVKAARDAARSSGRLTVALSGGSTPRILFEELSLFSRRDKIPWETVQLFWGDERCVPPDHPESNFGMVRETLLSKISIPEKNVHRIIGENRPESEARRYSEEIADTLGADSGYLPRFEWIFLGIGVDGHTASLFPDSPMLTDGKDICGVAEHPVTGQKRITLSLPVINNAARVAFLVTGKTKAEIVATILGMETGSRSYPASLVRPGNGTLEFYLDRQAASQVQKT
jgi:6-phosphogluconolactonase